MRRLVFALCLMAAPFAAPVAAQDAQTLADIRQDLTVLNVEIQRLKLELSTTTGASVPTGGSVLERVGLIEAALQDLTAKTEQLEFRIGQIVADGTNRIGDLEFRLVELEGGDVSQLGETSTLGGDASVTTLPAPVPTPTAPEGPQVAIGEEADFQAASEALASGDNARAATLFGNFAEAYPGSPFAVDAEMGRAQALGALGDTRESARAYLNAYNAAPEGARAPEALLELGRGLATLGQGEAACQIWAQLQASFPSAQQALDAASLARNAGCA
ncbi:tol-pal system protein [Roseobacteraceae bacterium S113]